MRPIPGPTLILIAPCENRAKEPSEPVEPQLNGRIQDHQHAARAMHVQKPDRLGVAPMKALLASPATIATDEREYFVLFHKWRNSRLKCHVMRFSSRAYGKTSLATHLAMNLSTQPSSPDEVPQSGN